MENDYQAIIEENIKELFDNIRPRMSDEAMERMEKLFNFAWEAHSKQKRKSGEPYIIHPIAVAKIVVQEIGLPAEQMLFIDDSQRNVDGAIAAGLPAVYYQPGTDLASVLAEALCDSSIL